MFLTGPFFVFELKVTLISPDSPGLIGALGGVGDVQLQDALTLEIISGQAATHGWEWLRMAENG